MQQACCISYQSVPLNATPMLRFVLLDFSSCTVMSVSSHVPPFAFGSERGDSRQSPDVLQRVSLMIALRRLLLALAGALVCAAASLPPLGAQQPTGTITGQVIDSATRQPLVGVNVVVEGTGLSAISREDGTFSIDGVPAGTHTLRARRTVRFRSTASPLARTRCVRAGSATGQFR